MKTCTKCQQAKPLDGFYKHPKNADGHSGKCIECTKADVRANRIAKIDYYRAYDVMRASMPHRRENARRVIELWKSKWPKRRLAQVALGNAVRDGRIKSLPCFVCGDPAEAHHPDYDAPLAVSWLCRPHHKQLHAEHRKAA